MTILKSFLKQSEGFTLIELLVVISIVGFLATLGIYNVNLAKVKAEDVIQKNDLNQMRNALEAYYIDNGHYPGMNNGTPDCTLSDFWDYCTGTEAIIFSFKYLLARDTWPSGFANELVPYITLPIGKYYYLEWEFDNVGTKCDSKLVFYSVLRTESSNIHPCSDSFYYPNNYYIVILD